LFRLIHVPTRVAMWTHISELPTWGYGQQEINGNKKAADKSNIWYVDDIIADGSELDCHRCVVELVELSMAQ
jgi:dolichyl-phosphate-mannose-protein mannosyltransferase